MRRFLLIFIFGMFVLSGITNAQNSEAMLLPASTTVGTTVTADLSGLQFAPSDFSYELDWGDGSSIPFNVPNANSPNKSLNHVYTSAGTVDVVLYRVTVAGTRNAVATAKLVVVTPISCILNLTLNPTPFGSSTTAQVTGLPAGQDGVIDWADQTQDPYVASAQGAFNINHTFATTGTFNVAVRINSATGVVVVACRAVVVVSVPTPTLAVNPSNFTLGTQTTATLGSFAPGVTYTLDWGDGSGEPVTGVSSASIQHLYSEVGVKQVKISAPTFNVAPVIVPVTVTMPSCTLTLSPNPTAFGSVTTAVITGLPAGQSAAIDWADQTQNPFVANAQGGFSATHTFANTGTYNVAVTINTVEIFVVCRAVVVVNVPTSTMTVNPSSVVLGTEITAALSNLAVGVNYTLDWGDGQTEAVTGVSSSSVKHTFSSVGVKQVKISAPNFNVAPVIVPVTVTLPSCTLDLSPNPTVFGGVTTAQVTGLSAAQDGVIDWADQTQDPFVANAQGGFRATHTFTKTGTFNVVVRITVSGASLVVCQATVTVSIPAPTLDLNPSTVTLGSQTTATLGGLLAAVTYTFDWGDGQTEAVTGLSSVTLKHAYASVGVKQVKLSAPTFNVAPVIVAVTVTLPSCTLDLNPNPLNLGASLTAKVSGLPAGLDVNLNWGDGSSPTSETIKADGTTTVTYKYAKAGTFVVKVLYGVSVLRRKCCARGH